ncbi:MAG: serine hydrolase [Pseudomonadota bacterium]
MARTRIAMIAALLLAFALPVHGLAQSAEADISAANPEETAALEKRAADVLFLFQDRLVTPDDVFSERFLRAVPASQLTTVFSQIERQMGPIEGVQSVERTGRFQGYVTFRFANGFGSGPMALSPNAPHKIEGLLLNEFAPNGDGVERIEKELLSLPGEVSVYFGSLDGKVPRLEINADKQLAIGSTFKLYVLSALAREIIADDDRHWSEVVFVGDKLCLSPPCGPGLRSFTSGTIQNWPAPTPMTVQSLATLMISVSDNTASDELIRYLGEERVVQEMIESGHSAPERNQPFLTTRQMFALKAGGPEMIRTYRDATREERYEIAFDAEQAELSEADVQSVFASGPVAIDVEWFASAHDLRRLLNSFPESHWDTARKIMAINPSVGPGVKRLYSPIYYKGGSEPGVLNYTWLLRDIHGWKVLTMSWNNPESTLDETQFELLAQRLLSIKF